MFARAYGPRPRLSWQELGQTAKSTTADRPRFSLSGAGVAVAMAVVVLVVFGGVALLTRGSGDLANDPVSTVPSGSVPANPDRPFQGTWISTSDADGGTQTMTVGDLGRRRRRDRGARRHRHGVLGHPVHDDRHRTDRGRNPARHPRAGVHLRRRNRARDPERSSSAGAAP